MSALLSDLRGIGLPMNGRYPPTPFTDAVTKEDHVAQLHVGYTVDAAKADRAREMGATVTTCKAHDPSFTGWEISVSVVDP